MRRARIESSRPGIRPGRLDSNGDPVHVPLGSQTDHSRDQALSGTGVEGLATLGTNSRLSAILWVGKRTPG